MTQPGKNGANSLRGTLDGIRVADFSNNLAGPYAAMLLGDLGADVIKVERPQGGDDSRAQPPFWNGESVVYLTVNRNKRSIALDFKDETDVANAQVPLDLTAQELTGDWRGYQTRGPHRPIPLPVGQAPTQELGRHIFLSGIEGFLSPSAKIATNQNLVIFPENLRPGSRLTYADSNGRIVHHVPWPARTQ